MKNRTKPYLDPETYVEGIEFVDSETITADLEEALAESRRRMQDRNIPAQTTVFTADGRRIGPAMMTIAEMKAQAASLKDEPTSRLAYDAESDALHIRLHSAEVQHRDEVEPGIILNFDANGTLIGLDVLQSSKIVRQPVSEAA